MAKHPSPPDQDALQGEQGLASRPWLEWFSDATATFDKIPKRLGSVNLTAQAASIAATDFSGGSIPAGLYRVSYYARITQAATTSSSLTLVFKWTDEVTQTYTGTAIVGNTTATYQAVNWLLRSDARASITYTTTYASVGATPMNYSLDIYLEEMPT